MEEFEDFDDIGGENGHAIRPEDLVEPDFEFEFPGFTDYSIDFKILGRDVATAVSSGKRYWGHWEVNLFYPLLVSSFIVSSYFFIVTLVFPLLDKYPIFLCVLFTAIFGVYLGSYIKIIVDGPGYFPFCYPRKLPNESQSMAEISPSGVVSTDQQAKWAKKQSTPNRCVFSSTAGRYVIRPDHYCTYAASWIGKRNEKFCFLFAFWGMVYLGILLFLAFWGMMSSPDSALTFIILFVYALLSTFCFFWSVYRCCITFRAIYTNVTSWERWNDIDRTQYTKGLKYNFQDVFGQTNVLTWLLPTSPFSRMTNEELIADYDEYTVIDLHMQRRKRKHREKEKKRELKDQQRREKALQKLRLQRDAQKQLFPN